MTYPTGEAAVEGCGHVPGYRYHRQHLVFVYVGRRQERAP